MVVSGGRWASWAKPTARATSCMLDSTGRPLAYVTVSSMPTRRCPPVDSEASMTGMVLRPMPVAEKVVPSGRSRSICSAATSVAVVPGIPPGTPITKSTCTCPPCGRPYLPSSR